LAKQTADSVGDVIGSAATSLQHGEREREADRLTDWQTVGQRLYYSAPTAAAASPIQVAKKGNA